MNKATTRKTTMEKITPQTTREMFLNTASTFTMYRYEKNRRSLLQILQSNNSNVRDVLATCMNEYFAITVFVCATAPDDIDLLQAFHDAGMHVDTTDPNGDTALRNASLNGHVESVRWLLEHNATLDIQNNCGSTPLMYASQNGKAAVVELLLQNNANPDLQNNLGWTALMKACQNDHEEIVQLLLNFNVNIALKNKNGQSALDMAKSDAIKEMIENHVDSYVLK